MILLFSQYTLFFFTEHESCNSTEFFLEKKYIWYPIAVIIIVITRPVLDDYFSFPSLSIEIVDD